MCRSHKKRRLRKGGVGPEMRSPAGLMSRIIDAPGIRVKGAFRHAEVRA